MNKIFNRRKDLIRRQNFLYLRRIFNEQFISFLFLALILASYYYIKNIDDFILIPGIRVYLLIYSFFILSFGNIATYLEKADEVFLIDNPKIIKKHLKLCFIYSTFRNIFLQFFLNLLILPFLIQLFDLKIIFLYFIFFLCLKVVFLSIRYLKFFDKTFINLRYVIKVENKRVSKINNFLSFFTNVKDIKKEEKPTKLWNLVIKFFPKYNLSYNWILFVRNFFRSKRFIQPIFVTCFLFLFLIYFSKNLIISGIFSVLGIFVVSFQLRPLFNYSNNNIMVRIYPYDLKKKTLDFKKLAAGVIFFITLFFIIFLVISHPILDNIYWVVIDLFLYWLVINKYLLYLVKSRRESKEKKMD